MAAADLITETEAALVLRQSADMCLAVYCDEGQAARLAAEAARERCQEGRSVRMVVPNGNARTIVAHALGDTVDVVTVMDLAQRVLAEEARVGECAAPVVLDAVQRRLLFEDMKVLGGKPRRIEELCKFLCRGVSEFSHEDPDWLISDEERSVLAELWSQLQARGALLPSFAGSAACRALESEELAARLRVDDLFAVGFTAYDEAQQHMAARLGDRVVAFGRADDPGVSEITYGHPEGMGKWASYARTVEVAPNRGCIKKFVRCVSDEQEVATVAQFLARDTYAHASVTLLVQNGYWADRYEDALAEAGIDYERYGGCALHRSDPRKAQPGDPAFLYGILALAAEPEGVLSRRTWLGLGDWLGASDQWEAIRREARRRGVTEADILDELACGRVEQVEDATTGRLLAKASAKLTEGAGTAARLVGLRGEALVEALSQESGVTDVRAVLSPVVIHDEDDASALFARLRDAMEQPCARRDKRVTLAEAQDADYLLSDGVIATGLVDGLATRPEASDESAPRDLRQKALDEGEVRLKSSLLLGEKFAIATCFDAMGLAEASRAGVEIKRIRVERAGHRATTAPTVLIERYL